MTGIINWKAVQAKKNNFLMLCKNENGEFFSFRKKVKVGRLPW